MKHLLTLVLSVTLFPPVPLGAEGLFSAPQERAALFARQTALIDARQGPVEVKPARTVALPPMGIWGSSPLILQPRPLRGPDLARYQAAARRIAGANGVPVELFLRLVQQESGWNRDARSPVGAIGLAQLMPATARELRVDPHDPLQNLDGGARYLRQQYDRFGNWRLALAAYNAGPGAVAKYRGVPPYGETRSYIRRILGG